ncbi:MAG: hypothetical protein SPL98_07425, partial [Bacteroidales bacterium]|nr:hypothetical protein [Bacteroidales bacterium]MDY6403800.1 hypothetical protein [Bacteroidales bacterium]MDY6424728.1 hypothetical protein [Bacteroidales bacterium]
YSTPTAMMDEAVRMHYEAEDNLTQNDFEKQQQAMIDRAEKREEDRIQDEKIKENALSEEDYERMQQGFDEQEKASETDNQGNPIDEEGNLVLSHRVPNGTAEIISEDERVLVDALVDMLGETIGSENVITNEAEAKRLIDEANGEDVKYSSDKERQDLTTTIHPSSEHGAKLQINLKTAKENLKNLTDFYKGIKNSRGFIKAITTALGGNKTDTQSHYFEFNAKNGDIITLRVSNHNTNSEHYNDNEQVVSIVVKSRRHPNTFIGNANADVKEYVYFKENIKDDTLSLIAESVRDLLETGEYKDKTGIAVVNEFSRKSNNLKLHKVYHGSGADFEAFDHSHMGEGEGNQAYGWGTYVTEAEGIGRTYADTVLNRDNPHKDVKYIGDNPKYADEIAPLFKNGVRTYEEVKDFIAKSSNPRKDEHLQWFLSTRPEQWQSPNAGKRHLYTVEIPKDNGKNYLAWDGYVSNEQYPMWYEAMKILGEQDGFAKPEEILPFKEGHTRVSIEHEVKYLEHKHTPKAVSEALHKAGFTGIKYPAQYRSGGREDGAKNYVIFNEKDLKITDKVQFFKTKDGEVFGFTVGGKIYIDTERVKADTPLHEYTHLWAEALRKVNPKEWQNIVSLMKKQTYLWDKVKNDYPELKTDDEIADEVLAHYSGERGKKLLDEEYDKIRGNNKMNIFDKAKMLQAINNVREALRKFWKGVADFLGIHFTSAEEVADKVLSDLLEGVNPNEVKSATDNVGTFDSENADIRFHKSTERVVEKATDKALEIASKHI